MGRRLAHLAGEAGFVLKHVRAAQGVFHDPAATVKGSHICTDEWRGSFNVGVDHDVADAVVTVTFEGPLERCGVIYVGRLTFTAGRRQAISTSTPLYLTYEPEGQDNLAVVQYCPLPAATERLVVELWNRAGGIGSAARPLLRQAFPYAYTFTTR